MNHDSGPLDELANQANEARSKLLHTVDELEHRKRDLLDWRSQVRRHVPALTIASGLILFATGGATVARGISRARAASGRRRHDRWVLAKTLWVHPERGFRSSSRPFVLEVLRSLLLAAVTATLAVPVRRAVTRWLPSRSGKGLNRRENVACSR
jgi:hypothetical protein